VISPFGRNDNIAVTFLNTNQPFSLKKDWFIFYIRFTSFFVTTASSTTSLQRKKKQTN
jgi:hypothetical protein